MVRKMQWLPTITLLAAFGVSFVSGLCGRGTFLNTSGENHCQLCPKGTYISEDGHSRNSCLDCTLVDYESSFYRVISECSATSNVVINCTHPHYYADYYSKYARCLLCTNCTRDGKFFKQPCQANQDSICCPEKGVDCRQRVASTQSPTENKDIRKQCDTERIKNQSVVFRSIDGCLRGEFYACDNGTDSVACTPCPRGTYVNESRHFSLACRFCNSTQWDADVPPECRLLEQYPAHVYKGNEVMVGVLSAIGAAVLMAVVCWIWYCKCARKKKLTRYESGDKAYGQESVPMTESTV
ncbi:hypothetical protein ElyMa_000980300 [Elysia marginata]|uniref:TNFR-Cys domain-containing protein n=1 Tax=Elysia marginata TaxID=1093978 RepID=A0AAV4HH40_9GAST|nr:hypothetical protein ElyMa_000980300 [Elysia marginata]